MANHGHQLLSQVGKHFSVAVEGQHAAVFTWKFLQHRKIQRKDEKWAGCITHLANVTSGSK